MLSEWQSIASEMVASNLTFSREVESLCAGKQFFCVYVRGHMCVHAL